MKEKLTVTYPRGTTFTDLMAALQEGAIAHSTDLNIHHDRMLEEFGLLWMLVRCRLEFTRWPQGEISVETFLRKPNAASSIRDFTLSDSQGVFGTAVQTWGLVDAQERKLVNMRKVPAMEAIPYFQPERTGSLRHLNLPEEMKTETTWTVSPEEIDGNGHLNNVRYIRHAEALLREDCRILEIIYERECFRGETLRLETARTDGFYVRGVKEDGEESFRLCFRKEEQ